MYTHLFSRPSVPAVTLLLNAMCFTQEAAAALTCFTVTVFAPHNHLKAVFCPFPFLMEYLFLPSC